MKVNIVQKQNGYSLVEVLIAVVIGLLLLAGILQIFLNSKNTYRLEYAFTQVQENGRFISKYLASKIRLAGYRTLPANGLFPALDSVFSNANPYIFATNGAGNNNSDSLTIRFQGSGDGLGNPDNTIRDCLNQPVDANSIATNVFSINANNELTCQATNPDANPVTSTQVLLADIESMQFTFGEDLDGDNTPDRYVEADHPNLDFSRVVSAKVAILIASQESANPNVDNRSYNLLGTIFTAGGDNLIRQELSFTVQLRNLIEQNS